MSNLKLSDFNYNLPENLIAQKPTKPRDHCRLLVINRHCEERPKGATKPARPNASPTQQCHSGGGHSSRQSYFEHKKFFEIEKFLQKGDVLVLNDSKVIPARLIGRKIIMQEFPTSNTLNNANNTHYQLLNDRSITDNVGKYDNTYSDDPYGDDTQNIVGGKVEILLIKKISGDKWEAMLKNFKEKELGKKIILAPSLRGAGWRGEMKQSLLATPIKNIGEGLWQIKFNLTGAKLDKAIHKYGHAPLPPYIKKSTKLEDYQTIYAKKEGSVAAPTAGLHFTKTLINKLEKRGIVFEKLTLHIGLGTFAPIREENIEKHKMHAEIAEISAKTARAINKAKVENRRVIAVGTTSLRTLEAFIKENQRLKIKNQNDNAKSKIKSGTKNVNIFIKPGYDFKIVNGIITNFHLPKTTLMILISAFAGRDKILRAYQEAIKKKYKFFSFGDSMFII